MDAAFNNVSLYPMGTKMWLHGLALIIVTTMGSPSHVAPGRSHLLN